MGPYAGVDFKSPYRIVNSIVSYPFKLQKGSGVEKISPLVEHMLYLSAKFQNWFLLKERSWKWARADLMSLNRHFIEHGQAPCLS
jgi:hypothetical protein